MTGTLLLREAWLKRNHQKRRFGLGAAVTATLGFGMGVLVGMIGGEWLGDVDSDRMRSAVKRLKEGDIPPGEDPAMLERDLLSALRSNSTTRGLDIGVRTLENGLVELTGTVPDERARELAGELARAVPGAAVLVNRILVEGIDTSDQPAASISSAP